MPFSSSDSITLAASVNVKAGGRKSIWIYFTSIIDAMVRFVFRLCVSAEYYVVFWSGLLRHDDS